MPIRNVRCVLTAVLAIAVSALTCVPARAAGLVKGTPVIDVQDPALLATLERRGFAFAALMDGARAACATFSKRVQPIGSSPRRLAMTSKNCAGK